MHAVERSSSYMPSPSSSRAGWCPLLSPLLPSVYMMYVCALSRQMVTNAKAAGDEIAALKMRVMEMEMEIGSTAVAMPAGHR